jgi:hypothetical protein
MAVYQMTANAPMAKVLPFVATAANQIQRQVNVKQPRIPLSVALVTSRTSRVSVKISLSLLVVPMEIIQLLSLATAKKLRILLVVSMAV